MDISMPAGNGFSVAERIQAIIPTRISIIFMTASKKPEFREKETKMGRQDISRSHTRQEIFLARFNMH
jgi:CheY-like chemotaxis protein